MRQRTRRPRRPGLAVTELAILLPFLALMVAIAADFCRVYHTTQVLNRCAHSAALYAARVSIPKAGQSAEDAGRAAAIVEGAGLNPPLQDGNLVFDTSTAEARVTVTYEFTPIIRLPGHPEKTTLQRSVALTPAPWN